VIFRAVAALFALLFLFAAGVQWNDPDPLLWMLGYAAVAGVSAAAAFGLQRRAVTVVVLLAIGGAFLFWLPSLQHTSPEALRSFGMSGAVEEEEVREAIGLGLATAWLIALLIRR
jgi:hypothetical protein